MFFPKFYVDSNKFGFQNKVQFTMYYQNWKRNKLPAVTNDANLGKNPVNLVKKVESF